ncbi:ABC transporter ATP-binding protein [Micrococcaceae bacterium Sec5.1]
MMLESITPPTTSAADVHGTSALDQKFQVEYSKVARTFNGRSGSFVAVRDIDLQVRPGEFVSIIGPSGCGKSTLLNMAAGLLDPSEGTVSYSGKPVQRTNTDVGYVTQKDSLLPWRTVERNVGLPLELHKIPKDERKQRVSQMLRRVGLEKFAKHYPSQLSGGMRQRAMLAQTWVYGPHTLLMDEPFGALDALLRTQLQADLLEMWQREQKTILFVTHDLEEAILMADRVVVFSAAPGTILHVESVNFERPRDLMELRSTREFVDIWKRLWNLLETQINVSGVSQ